METERVTKDAPLVAITGASGFIGRVVARTLHEDGWRVRGIFRGDAPAGWNGEAARVADITDSRAMTEALEGTQALVHLAARVHVMHETVSDPALAFRETNVRGTQTVLDAARRTGVRQVVFGSSVKAMAEASNQPLVESTPARPEDPYGMSKREAEDLVEAFGRESGRVGTSLRFPLVYGPGVRANMLRLFGLVDRGVPLPFASVRNARSMLYVGNAAATIAALLRAPTRCAPLYLVSDGDDVSSPELIRRIAHALGRPARLLPVPEWVFGLAGRSGDAISRVLPWPLTSAAMARLTGSLAVDSSKVRRDLGFSMPFSMQAGLAHTARWYRSTHGGQVGGSAQ